MLQFITQGHLGVGEWLHGRLAEAENVLSTSMHEWRAAGHRNLIGWGCYHLGQVERALGRLDAAWETYEETLRITAEPGRPTLPAAGIAYAGLAEVAYQRNELDAALRHVTAGIPLCRQFSFTPPLATALATLAWARQAAGDTVGALAAMGDAMRAAPGPAVGDLLNPVPAQQARLLLVQGDVEAAESWTISRGLLHGDEPDYPRELGYLLLARVLLAQDGPDQAVPLLQRLRAAAAAQGRTGSLIEIQALLALALAADGDGAAALDALAEALLLGHPAGYLRVFADEGAPMRALVGRLVAAQRTARSAARAVPLDYLARLVRAFDERATDPGSRRPAATAPPGLVETLTAREAEVLVLIAAGKSNPRIAEELVVTLDTVKKHVSHVLGKLGAANRTEAVTRARQLGLIA
jgi:LuxR family maltose regulon positive regulatory protein